MVVPAPIDASAPGSATPLDASDRPLRAISPRRGDSPGRTIRRIVSIGSKPLRMPRSGADRALPLGATELGATRDQALGAIAPQDDDRRAGVGTRREPRQG